MNPISGGGTQAICTGSLSCSNDCMLFAVKKPWIKGGYKDGIIGDRKIRYN